MSLLSTQMNLSMRHLSRSSLRALTCAVSVGSAGVFGVLCCDSGEHTFVVPAEVDRDT